MRELRNRTSYSFLRDIEITKQRLATLFSTALYIIYTADHGKNQLPDLHIVAKEVDDFHKHLAARRIIFVLTMIERTGQS